MFALIATVAFFCTTSVSIAGDDVTCDVLDMKALFVRLISTEATIITKLEDFKKTLVEEIERVQDKVTKQEKRIDALDSKLNETVRQIDGIVGNITVTANLSSFLKRTDGGWSTWSAWTDCPVTCHIGLRKRTRSCNNPAPSSFGRGCVGNDEEVTICNSIACPDTDDCIDDPCKNGATCVDGVYSYSCNCAAGYTGRNCDIDIDDCIGHPCKNGATCADGVANYSCQCVAGYTDTNCETDNSDCIGHACKNGATCVDEVSSYSCKCALGYSGAYCDTVLPECSNKSSSLYCNCTVECPFAEDEVLCECKTGYSNDFVTIPGKVLNMHNLMSQIVSDAEECKQLCVINPGCLNCELSKNNNNCFLNDKTPFNYPDAFANSSNYDFYYRQCIC